MPKLAHGKYLAQLGQTDPRAAAFHARTIEAINHLARQLGVDPVGQSSAPPSPDALDVTVTGETAHLRVTNNNPISRATKHWVEIHTSPQFDALKRTVSLDSSRDGEVTLPTMNAAGVMQDYYAQVFSQKPGSPPSPATPYPTYITMDGGTSGDVPESAGSGTAAANGRQTVQGFGKVPTRAGTGPKRAV